jgi:hypothetical protein
MFVTYIRVRTTSESEAPASFNAPLNIPDRLDRLRIGISNADNAASGPVAVVPDTLIAFPMRTAREYPTIGSHFTPLEICFRTMASAPLTPFLLLYTLCLAPAWGERRVLN